MEGAKEGYRKMKFHFEVRILPVVCDDMGVNFKSSMCGKKSLKRGLTFHFLSYYARANQEKNVPVVASI